MLVDLVIIRLKPASFCLWATRRFRRLNGSYTSNSGRSTDGPGTAAVIVESDFTFSCLVIVSRNNRPLDANPRHNRPENCELREVARLGVSRTGHL